MTASEKRYTERLSRPLSAKSVKKFIIGVETIDHSHPTELKEEAFWKTPIFELLRILLWASSCWPSERANLLVVTHRGAYEPAAPQLE